MKFIYSPFILIFPVYVTSQFNNLLQVGLIAQSIRARHRYRRGQESNPVKLNLFQAFFSLHISCVFNCQDFLRHLFLHPAVQMYGIHKFINQNLYLVNI